MLKLRFCSFFVSLCAALAVGLSCSFHFDDGIGRDAGDDLSDMPNTGSDTDDSDPGDTDQGESESDHPDSRILFPLVGLTSTDR